MAQRTSDNDGNENLRAGGEERSVNMRADAREAPLGDRAFHHNASVTNTTIAKSGLARNVRAA